jgi:hypothetical protein
MFLLSKPVNICISANPGSQESPFMDTIGEYVKHQCEDESRDAYFKVADCYEKALKHQKEAARLARMGDHRQAQLHFHIARKHGQAAIRMEVSQPELASMC